MRHVDRLFVQGENLDDFQLRHNEGVKTFSIDSKGIAALSLIRSWLSYADRYRENFNNDTIGKDYYAGPEWATMGASLLQLLNMDHGPYLHSATLHNAIRGAMEAEGFNPDTEDWRN